jgi:hypothetical protein
MQTNSRFVQYEQYGLILLEVFSPHLEDVVYLEGFVDMIEEEGYSEDPHYFHFRILPEGYFRRVRLWRNDIKDRHKQRAERILGSIELDAFQEDDRKTA